MKYSAHILLLAFFLVPHGAASLDTGRNATIPPYVAEGYITRKTYWPGDSNVQERAEAAVRFFHSKGWWEVQV
jgi:hypothetical protein